MTEATEKITSVEGPPIIAAIKDIVIGTYQRLLIDNHNLYQHIETLTKLAEAQAMADAMGVAQKAEPVTAAYNVGSPTYAELSRQVSDLQKKNVALEGENRALKDMNARQSETIVSLKDQLTEAMKPRNKNAVLSHALGIYCANVGEWVIHTFGSSALFSMEERALRFMEEATELAQACGLSYARVGAVQKHVYGRTVGTVRNEIGGTIHTLAALAAGMSMPLGTIAIEVAQSGWDRQKEIREKNDRKPASIRAHFG